MSKYFGALRWADDAVAAINWDNEEKTGTVTVTDETTGEVYEIGGSSMFKITVTWDADNNQFIMDKTFKEIEDAVEGGAIPCIYCNNTSTSEITVYGGIDMVSKDANQHYSVLCNLGSDGEPYKFIAETETSFPIWAD